jgi:hypothetical protein
MATTLNDKIAGLAPQRRAKVEARAKEILAEIDSLADIRKLAGKSQAQIAAQLGAKQPSVHKMEKQADFYVSTLRRFVEAAGGSVEIRVNLPGKAPVVLKQFADLRSD